jgi:cysteine desulfurase family protein
LIYLNNAATTFPKPASVVRAVTEYLNRPPVHAKRSGFGGGEDIIGSCRAKLAALFNIPSPNQVVFTSGATEALNLAIRGLDFKGGHIVTTTTEHNSVYRPLVELQEAGDIEATLVDCDSTGFVSPEAIAAAVKNETRAIIVNHCSNVTGRVQDLKAIGAAAHVYGVLFIVDASQSAGFLPIDPITDHIDILVFTGHKSLYGLPGSGGLYIREGLRPRPLKTGGTGVRGDLMSQPGDMPLYYEAGTPNSPGITALSAGLDFIQSTGMDTIHRKKEQCIELIYSELKTIPGIRIHGKDGDRYDSSVLSFEIEGMALNDVVYMLEHSFDIIIRGGLHCAPLVHQALGTYPKGTLRVSPSYFTSEKETGIFIDAIKRIIKSGSKRNIES